MWVHRVCSGGGVMRGRLKDLGDAGWQLVVVESVIPCRTVSGRRTTLEDGLGVWDFPSELAACRFAKRKGITLEETE